MNKAAPAPTRAYIAIAVLGLAVVVAGTFYGGLGPARLAGLPYAGRVTEIGLPLLRMSSEILACVVAGYFLGAGLLLRSRSGKIEGTGREFLSKASALSLVWTICVLLQLVFSYSQFAPVPLLDAFSLRQIGAFVEAVPQAKALFLQGCLASILTALAFRLKSSKEATVALLIALITVTPPPLTGHAAGLGSHSLATSTLSLHVIAATLWAGGVFCLFVASRTEDSNLGQAVARFSPIAAWCFVAVFISGIANALLRVESFSDLFTTTYGSFIVIKFLAAVGLGYLGYIHRKVSIPKLDAGVKRSFARYIAVELGLMAATFGVAVSLARSASPPDLTNVDPVELQIGFKLPEAVSVTNLITKHALDGFALILAIFAIAFFVLAVRRTGGFARAQLFKRFAFWLIGWLIVTLVTSGGIGLYSHVLFSYHAVQQVALVFLVPIFLIAAKPLALMHDFSATKNDTAGPVEWVLELSNSLRKVNGVVLLVATALISLTSWVIYFSDLFGEAMKNHFGHILMEGFFLASGCAFYVALKSYFLAKRSILDSVIAPAIVNASIFLFSIVLYGYNSEIAGSYYAILSRDWGPSSVSEQHIAAYVLPFAAIPLIAFTAFLSRHQVSASDE